MDTRVTRKVFSSEKKMIQIILNLLSIFFQINVTILHTHPHALEQLIKSVKSIDSTPSQRQSKASQC